MKVNGKLTPHCSPQVNFCCSDLLSQYYLIPYGLGMKVAL